MRPSLRIHSLAVLLVVAPWGAAYSEVAPTVALVRTELPIAMDGVLEESAWTMAEPVSLVQQDPHPGGTTPYTTTVRFLAQGQRIYIGVRCGDPHPVLTEVHSLQYDDDRTDDDHVTLVLDTVGSNRVGYVFEVNAGGARSDGLISPSAPQPSYDWNGIWNAKAWRDAKGWSAEIVIDVRSLQFHAGTDNWRLNIRRYVPRERLNLQCSSMAARSPSFDGRWRLELRDETDIGRLPVGRFTQRLWQVKGSYGFSPDLHLASLIQYDSNSGHVGVNARLRWIIQPGRELYLVLNHGVVVSGTETRPVYGPIANSVILKANWDIRSY